MKLYNFSKIIMRFLFYRRRNLSKGKKYNDGG